MGIYISQSPSNYTLNGHFLFIVNDTWMKFEKRKMVKSLRAPLIMTSRGQCSPQLGLHPDSAWQWW